jgi:hypothetical protein
MTKFAYQTALIVGAGAGIISHSRVVFRHLVLELTWLLAMSKSSRPAHVLAKRGGPSDEQMNAARSGESSDAKTAAVLRFAAKAAREHGRVSEGDLVAVREAGYNANCNRLCRSQIICGASRWS